MQQELQARLCLRLKRLELVRDCECWDTERKHFVSRVSFNDHSSVLLEGEYLENAFPSALLALSKQKGRLVLTPQMSARGHAICEEERLNYLDAAGNCFISLDRVYISEKGNRAVGLRKRRGEQSAFEPSSHASSRVLRVLMENPNGEHSAADLAQAAGCSLAQAYKVAGFLSRNLLLENRGGRLRVTDAARLMQQWGRVYALRRQPVVSLFSLDSLSNIEAKLRELAKAGKTRALLTGIAGGNRYAPAARYNRLQLLCPDGETDSLAKQLGCKPCASGANILVTPCIHDEFFMAPRMIRGDAVASPVQVYLDCLTTPARGEEQAEAILKTQFARNAG